MSHEIDLGKYQIRTDLAVEAIGQVKEKDRKKVESKIEEIDGITVTDVVIRDDGGKEIGKKDGRYITVEFEDITDHDNRKKVESIVVEQLKKLISDIHMEQNQSCVVIGLGNSSSTPDALGPMVASRVLVTNHLFEYGEVEDGFRPVATFTPGVMGQTGIETMDLIRGLVGEVHPDFMIVVDALASQSVNRVNRTIQMTDTGIHPGSGVGNHRKEISKETLGIPVIAIGVPTVVDAVTIVSDTIHYMQKHFSYMKKHYADPSHLLTPLVYIDPSKETEEMSKKEKEDLFGMLGTLSSVEMKQLIFEVLTPIGYNLIVTPKEVDFVMDGLTEVIRTSIDRALHQKVTE